MPRLRAASWIVSFGCLVSSICADVRADTDGGLVLPAAELQQLTRLACAGRSPCRVVDVRDAGSDAAGSRLRAVELALFPPDHPHADGSPAYLGDECARFEWVSWIAPVRGSPRTEELTQICNDGYGASGIGDDTIEVAPNRFTHMRMGGSSWRWSESKIMSLSPRRLLASSDDSYWANGDNQASHEFDYEHFHARGSWFAPLCNAPSHSEEDRPATFDWDAIAAVAVSQDIMTAITRGEMRLGGCALELRGAPTAGAQGGAPRHWLRALLVNDGTLVIEVSRADADAHGFVEIYLRDHDRPDTCAETVHKPEVLRVDLYSGRVRAPRAMRSYVKSQRIRLADGNVRLLVQVGQPKGVTLVLKNRAGRVVQNIMTSTLNRRDDNTVGDIWRPSPGTCRVVDESGLLEPDVESSLPANHVLFESP